jgi:hypothetical protein
MDTASDLRRPLAAIAVLLAVIALSGAWYAALPNRHVAFTGPYPGACPDGWSTIRSVGTLSLAGCQGDTPWAEWPATLK